MKTLFAHWKAAFLTGLATVLPAAVSIVLVPEADVVKLDMSVADGIKFIMSLGSVSPAYPSQEDILSAGTAGSNGSGVPRTGEAMAPVEPEDLTRFEGEGGPELLSRPHRT